MPRDLTSLPTDLPVWAAPMAGGAGTPALVAAAARVGGLGFLAGGYKTPADLVAQIARVRATGVVFGVNLFAPNPVPVAPDAYRTYARVLQREADRYHLTLPAEDVTEDDDAWAEKLALLLKAPVPLVSFTFGLPHPDTVRALQSVGSLVAQTVTTPAEALAAAETGADLLIVQSAAAGGHSATLTPARPLAPTPLPDLVSDVRHAVPLPVIAAGGIATPAGAAAALNAGAHAVMVGTVLLRTHESGASAPYKAALADPAFTDTTLTRAFTGRPARALRNRFTDTYETVAPLGYPAVHHLTSPLRKAATAANDTELIHLWAGTGHRRARAEPAADTLTRLATGG
ncbi:nitronate monooxygenase [Kitasatospora sp. CM 4170]|uniref:Propionate 3-nitronate monooxygenase n=1 Tax=Kitasatospora aburaviensis TaxID=67265 RepID=A0ABW1F7R4_9ACTN|nr:nitronate monooxygenase [Kitasatospora sp. CM 4170]WNM43328.1 nitronate monooxygenase [Kitasatospora sp. CM 4170]